MSSVLLRKPAGHIIEGATTVADTACCVHCGGHWVVQRGSGIARGFCMNCNGPYCGPGCQNCIPTEKMLETIERNHARMTRSWW